MYVQVISEQHPKSLLILDDVWSFDVAQAFAVRCCTMVTSRNAAVANGILTPQIYNVSVSEGTNLNGILWAVMNLNTIATDIIQIIPYMVMAL